MEQNFGHVVKRAIQEYGGTPHKTHLSFTFPIQYDQITYKCNPFLLAPCFVLVTCMYTITSVGWEVKWCPVSRIKKTLGTQNTVSLDFVEE